MPFLRDTPLASQGNTTWYDHYASIDVEIRARSTGLWQIDSFPGATDDAKHVAAWNAARSATRKPILQYPARTFGPLNTPIAAFDGMRAIGPDGNIGVKNLELSSGNLVNHRVRVECGTGLSSLFVQSSSIQDVVFAEISWSGNASSQWWHNTNGATQTIYPCQFDSLAFDGFNSVLGNSAQKFTMTQGVFTGHWTVLNYSNTPIHLGGSDNTLWMGGMLNSNSPASVAGAGKPIVHLDYCEKTSIGYMYITAENGWSGVRIEGPVSRSIKFYGGTYEGRSNSNHATWPVIDVRGCRVAMYGPDINYVASPATGAIVQTGGVFTLHDAHYNKAVAAANTFPLFYQTGGVASIQRPVNGDGVNPIRIRWKDAAIGPQDQDVPFPTGNSITNW